MTNAAMQMRKDLIPLQGKSAAEMTHALKSMSSGTMVDGLIKRLDLVIAEKNYYERLSETNLVKGLVLGGVATLIVDEVVHKIVSARKEKRHREQLDFIKDTYSHSMSKIKEQLEEIKRFRQSLEEMQETEKVGE